MLPAGLGRHIWLTRLAVLLLIAIVFELTVRFPVIWIGDDAVSVTRPPVPLAVRVLPPVPARTIPEPRVIDPVVAVMFVVPVLVLIAFVRIKLVGSVAVT